MKVLFTCFSQSWGGMEMFALTTIKQLIKHNIETDLACFPGSRLHKEAVKENVPVHTFKQRSYFHPIEILNLSSLIKHNRYSLVECGGSKDLWLVVPALKIAQLKLPLFLSKQMASFIIKKDFLHRWLYKRVNKTFAISKRIKDNLIETTPLLLENIVLLHNAIDTSIFDPAKIDPNVVRKEFEIGHDQILIGMIARFSPGKGHEEFLLAAKSILANYPKVKFVIVGEASHGEENYAEKIKSFSQELGIKENIIFAGFRKDIPLVLAALDIFIFPSHDEAFGIALAEALSMGKPSVCSNFAGVLDIAVDGVTSYLFEKGNAEDLAKKAGTLIQSIEKRNQFGYAARKRAVEMFDLEVFTHKLIANFEESLK
jgi:glycosyltransferase involved in cell wall biosynthesis